MSNSDDSMEDQLERAIYELRFPFRPLHWVTGLDNDYKFEVEGFQGLIQAEEPFLVIKLRSFFTEQEALDYMPVIWDALARLAVDLGSGFVANMTTNSLIYATDPDKAAENLSRTFDIPNTGPVHGLVDGHAPSVIPIGKSIRTLKAGEPTVRITLSADRYAPAFVRALSQHRESTIYSDERLRTAIDLLCDVQREGSRRARFLTCIIALEVLSAPLKKHAIVQQMLDELDANINKRIQGFDTESDEHHALNSLQRELVYRREASLRSSMRKLILEGLSDLPEDELRARAKSIVWAYDVRGTLVHDGVIPETELRQAYDIAYEALIDLLKRRMGIL